MIAWVVVLSTAVLVLILHHVWHDRKFGPLMESLQASITQLDHLVRAALDGRAEFHAKHEEHETRISDHERRITRLEKQIKE